MQTQAVGFGNLPLPIYGIGLLADIPKSRSCMRGRLLDWPGDIRTIFQVNCPADGCLSTWEPCGYNRIMVLFNRQALLDLPRYGIGIPALDSRKIRTLESLTNHAGLKDRMTEWLIDSYEDSTTLEDILRVHGRDYGEGFFDHRLRDRLIHAFELVNPDGSLNRWNPEDAEQPLEAMLPALLQMQAGTWRAARIGLETGFCHYLGGGTHHGHREFGHGFCPLNDTAIAVRRLQNDNHVRNVWIIDVDAHKGDGTAAIFSGDDSVFTVSLHMAKGWPLDGSLPEDHPSWIPSDIDVGIPSGGEGDYLDRLDQSLKSMAERSTADLAFVLAGADPWEGDELPSSAPISLSMDQITERDRLIYSFLEDRGVPSAWLTAGGYGRQSWRVHSAFLSWVLPRRLKG